HFVQMSQAESQYSTDRMADQTMRFARTHADAPVVALYAPYRPHGPYAPAHRHIGAFAGLPPARPPNFRPANVSLKPNWVRFSRNISNTHPTAGHQRGRRAR